MTKSATDTHPGRCVWDTALQYHNGTFYIITASSERCCPQGDDRVWSRGSYVKGGNVWDSTSWSGQAYFDEAGFDQDVCTSHAVHTKYTLDHIVSYKQQNLDNLINF